ncbi:hypothetical protein GCM10007028_04500 [Algibacter mikhailovii]|uniref:Uncharacterized protein n=1 Tax=Algibacter mikhailovii TaxID=425498 RepID=A0A918QS56_9FLAO|nr:hypothetical protein GCM10007028_04500 [Algibacter mikhailovii]
MDCLPSFVARILISSITIFDGLKCKNSEDVAISSACIKFLVLTNNTPAAILFPLKLKCKSPF